MLRCMRTTIRLDEGLLRELKEAALEERTTMTSLIEQALRESLARRRQPARQASSLPTFTSPFQPGVDLDSNERLLDLLDNAR